MNIAECLDALVLLHEQFSTGGTMLLHCFSHFAFLDCSRLRPLNSNEFDPALYVALGMEITSIPLPMHLAFVGTYVYGCIYLVTDTFSRYSLLP